MAERDDAGAVRANYTPGDLSESILTALRDAGKDMRALTPDDLAPVDQFHLGGKAATLALIERAGLAPGMRVLDLGGGLGGSARTLATTVGCHVTVLDLSEEYCRVGAILTEWTGLSDRVTFRHGNALDISFADGAFDAVWTQHATMNIADKERLAAEIHRVLRPGGRYVLHEVMAGPVQPIHFPVPWAYDASISFLRPPDEVRALLAAAGFTELVWDDVTNEPLPAAPGTTLLPAFNIVSDFAVRARNSARSRREDRIRTVQAVFTRH